MWRDDKQVFAAMGMEAIARRAQLNFTQSDMQLYRRLMPLQFEAGRMLRSRSEGMACYPQLRRATEGHHFQRIPRSKLLAHLRRAARRCKVHLLAGDDLHDWQDGFPFLSPTGMDLIVQNRLQVMVEEEEKRWVKEAMSRSKQSELDGGQADRATLRSWLESNRKTFVKMARSGGSENGAQLFRDLKGFCGSPLLWCSPEPTKLKSLAMLTPGRILLLTILGALNALSADATDDSMTMYGHLHTSLTEEDERVLIRFESLIAREMDKRTFNSEDVRVGHFACVSTRDVTHGETITPGELDFFYSRSR